MFAAITLVSHTVSRISRTIITVFCIYQICLLLLVVAIAFLSIITCTTLAVVGISCRHVSVCFSINLLQVGVLLKWLNVGRIMQAMPHNSPETLVFCCRKSQQNSNGLTPMEAPNAGGVR